jgi:hypothetical protein
MPIRTVLVLVGLFAACLAIVLIAWAVGSEFYLFLPGRRHVAPPSPSHPILVLIMLLSCPALFLLYSRHFGLVLFSILLGSLVLGSVVGYFMFAWTPTLVQWLLTVVMGVETAYGWTIHGDYFDY